jgi:hypothetical protein
MAELGWRAVDEIPQAAGWYRVKRDGEPRVRAFGQGHWWIPLSDGWLSADGCYEWEHLPICAMEPPESKLTPAQEWARANQLSGGFDPYDGYKADASAKPTYPPPSTAPTR